MKTPGPAGRSASNNAKTVASLPVPEVPAMDRRRLHHGRRGFLRSPFHEHRRPRLARRFSAALKTGGKTRTVDTSGPPGVPSMGYQCPMRGFQCPSIPGELRARISRLRDRGHGVDPGLVSSGRCHAPASRGPAWWDSVLPKPDTPHKIPNDWWTHSGESHSRVNSSS